MAKKNDKSASDQDGENNEVVTTKVEQILKMHQEHPEYSYREIARRLNTTESYVSNVISRHLKGKGSSSKDFEPLDELDYLRKIILSTWGNQQKAELIISLFRDHDPNNLKILYSLLNKAQCPKTAQELIIYSWAKHRHISPEEIKEIFKNNKSMLRTFKELGYFEGEEEEELEDLIETEKKKKEEESEDIEDILQELKKERLKELKKKLEELRLKKELRELEKQLGEYEDDTKEESFDFGGKDEFFDAGFEPPKPVMRKVIRPAINPVTGEILRDDKGNIIFETVEEPVDGSVPANQMDDMMRWMMALQQTKKEDPEKELLKKELEELKRKMEEEERRRKEEEERRRYEEQIKAMQEQMQKFQEQVMQMIQTLQEKNKNSGQKSFEQELLLKLLEDKGKVPPEVMRIIQEEQEIIKKLQEKPKDDTEKKELMKQIEELRKTLEKKEMEAIFSKYNQYINGLYQKIEQLEKEMSNKTAMSDEKYKIDKIISMDKERLNVTKEMIDKTTENILNPAMKMTLEHLRQQDMWNRYMMLLQEEQRRGLPPGTLIDRFLGVPKVTEDEKKKLLERIDEEMKQGA